MLLSSKKLKGAYMSIREMRCKNTLRKNIFGKFNMALA